MKYSTVALIRVPPHGAQDPALDVRHGGVDIGVGHGRPAARSLSGQQAMEGPGPGGGVGAHQRGSKVILE